MEIIQTPIAGLLLIQLPVFSDERGYFVETFHKEKMAGLGIKDTFEQDNLSFTGKAGTLRGLHLQEPPFAQAKLVSVIQGKVMDVAVDLRKESSTFGRHYAVELSGGSGKMLYIPAGFAHGFITLEADTFFSYKCSALYNRTSEVSILWNDPDLGINWGHDNPILSEKDKQGILFKNYTSPF